MTCCIQQLYRYVLDEVDSQSAAYVEREVGKVSRVFGATENCRMAVYDKDVGDSVL